MTQRTILLLAAVVLATSCAPVTHTSKLTAAPADALRCAANEMSSLGYRVSEVRESDGFLQGERSKHVSNPFTGAETFDRISVIVAAPKMRVVGECMSTPGSRARFPLGVPGRFDAPRMESPAWHIPSAEVRSETKRIATSCSGVPDSERASESGS